MAEPIRSPGSGALWYAALLVGCLAALAWVHGPLVLGDPILDRDDRTLLGPLAQLTSLGDYPRLILEGQLLDLQPVRDLSFLADLWLGRHLGLRTFHLTNVLIWVGIVALFHVLLRRLVSHRGVLHATTALFCLHPVFVNSVAWVSARKHLLACFFALGATVLLVSKAAQEGEGPARPNIRPRLVDGAMVALYVLSIASQPITILWPAWAAIYLRLRGSAAVRRFAVPLAACVVAAGVVGIANWLYYSSGPYLATGAAKFVAEDGQSGVRFLAHGRYLFNLVAPLRLSTDYYPGSLWNLVGLLGLAPVGLLLSKLLPRRDLLAWTIFYLAPLLVVTVRLTNVFVSDTYLLMPGVGFFCLVGLAADPLAKRRSGPALPLTMAGALACLVLGFALLGARQAAAWQSNERLWQHACEVEPTPNALAKHAFFLLQQGKAEEALKLALRLRAWSPGHPEAAVVLGRAVLQAPGLTFDERLSLFRQNPSDDPWYFYFLASLQAAGGDFRGAWSSMERALSQPARFAAELPVVVAEGVTLCRRAGAVPCEESLLRARALPSWNEATFFRRLNALQPRSAGVGTP